MAGKGKNIMKTFSVILVLLVLALSLPAQAEDKSAADVCSVHLCIVLDCGATSQRSWDMLKTTAIETLYSLKPGDRVEVIAAYPFKMYLQIDAVISVANKTDYEKMVKKLAALDKEFLFDSDMSRAVESAYQYLGKNSHGRKCCVILTSGKLNDGHVKEIRQLGLAFKARGWPLCIVCDRERTNRELLIAANNKELDIRFIDNASLSDWIDNVRSSSALKNLKDTTTQPKPKSETIDESVKAKDGKATSTVIPDGSVKQPIEVKIVELPQQKAIVDVNKPKVGQPPEKAKVKPEAVADKKVNGGKKRKSLVLDIIPIAILLTMILGAVVLIIYSGSKPASKPAPQTGEDKQYHLIALVFDQRYELGSLDTLGEITIGRSIGSTIYIDNETIEDKHLRIFRNHNGLKVQNLALSPIIVNGSELAHRKKAILDLPADIELTPEVTITVLSEPLEIDKEVNSHETENI